MSVDPALDETARYADPPTPGRAGAAAPATPAGQRLGRYELLRQLGRGGCGTVWEARHVGLGKVVAVKVLEGGSDDDIARFAAEARAMAELAHPHIVPVHDVGQEGARWFIAMDLAPGGTLQGLVDEAAHARVARGAPALPVERALPLVEPVARAVAFAHSRGIVHRDLKPSNVLLREDGVPLVADFGLARRLDAPQGITRTGEILGTPAYMAPEQASGAPVTTATDVWALGGVLHFLLLGEPPVPTTGHLARDVVRAATWEPPTPRRRLPALHPDLETIVLRALERDPARRYPSAQALADDLARHRAGEPILARRTPVLVRAARWVRRRRAPVALAVVALLGLAASAALLSELSLGWRAWEVVTDMRFAAPDDLAPFLALDGAWRIAPGEGLAVDGGTPARLALAELVPGDVRVELYARLDLLPGHVGGDLSVALLPQAGGEDEGYFVGFGSDGNAMSKILRRGRRVAAARDPAARIVPGRIHHVLVERAAGALRLVVDGREVLAWRDLAPLDLGPARVVVYTWDARVRVSHLRVLRRPAAVKARRVETADWLLDQGQLDAAALLYADVARDPTLAPAERDEALLKQALAELTAADGDPARAARARELLTPLAAAPGPLASLATLGLAEADLRTGKVAAGLARLPTTPEDEATREVLSRVEAALLRRGDHEARLVVLRAARARLAFDEAAARLELLSSEATSLLELGRAGEATSVLAAERDGDPAVRVVLAHAARRQGDVARARLELEAACAALSGSLAADVWLDRADLELGAGDHLAAARAIEAATAGATPGRAPDAVDALAVYSARVALARGDAGADATLHALAARGLAPGQSGEARAWGTVALHALAAAALERGDLVAARAALDSLTTSWPGPFNEAVAHALLFGAALDLRAGARGAGRAKARAVAERGRAWPLLRDLAAALRDDDLPARADDLRRRAGDAATRRSIIDALTGAVDPDPVRAAAALAAARDAVAGPAWTRAVGRGLTAGR